MKEQIQLSDHFTYGRLIRFTLPSIGMMIFMSIYSVVDGYFVSNFAGKTPFAALNLIFPFLMIMATVGFMFGTGGSAIVAKTFGLRDQESANRYFSLFVYVAFGLGVILAVISIVFLRPIAIALGAEGQLLEDAVLYGRIILVALPFNILQMLFQSFFVTAEKPELGLATTVCAGVANMILDAVLVISLPQEYKLAGAAIATAASQTLGGVIPLVYFSHPNSSLLALGKTNFDGHALLKTCINGSSELMSNISMNLVGMLYNIQLLHYAGDDGVAAYGAIMYVNFIFVALFIGYSTGVAPVISFHYGAENREELKGLLKKSVVLILSASGAMFLISEILSMPLAAVFVGYDPLLLEMTVHAFRIYSVSFLFAGIAIFGSAFFTALNDGITSAFVSFLRTLVFQIAAVMLMPLIWELDGIWFSIVAAELAALLLTFIFFIAFRKRYHYV